MSNDRNSGADDPVDRRLLQRYRQASGELDEQPAAAARAAILAAAAREVRAKPVNAASPRVRSRLPLAAAAAVLLSTLAVMLAIRTSEEMPQFSAPTEAVRTPTDKLAGTATDGAVATAPSSSQSVAPPAAPAPASELKMSDQAQSQRRLREQPAEIRAAQKRNENSVASPKLESAAGARSAVEQERQRSAETPAKTASSVDTGSGPEQNRPAQTEAPTLGRGLSSEEARQNKPAASPPPPEPDTRAKLRKDLPEAVVVPQPAPKEQAGGVARRDVARPATEPALAAAQSERKQVDETAAVWIERIIKLRREGRHDEADVELKRFRERYPQVQPPFEALPPVGTR